MYVNALAVFNGCYGSVAIYPPCSRVDEGLFQAGLLHGDGSYCFADGRVYEGAPDDSALVVRSGHHSNIGCVYILS